MTWHFNYHPSASTRSSAPVVSRWLWYGNRIFWEVAGLVGTWWIVFFLPMCLCLCFASFHASMNLPIMQHQHVMVCCGNAVSLALLCTNHNMIYYVRNRWSICVGPLLQVYQTWICNKWTILQFEPVPNIWYCWWAASWWAWSTTTLPAWNSCMLWPLSYVWPLLPWTLAYPKVNFTLSQKFTCPLIFVWKLCRK